MMKALGRVEDDADVWTLWGKGPDWNRSDLVQRDEKRRVELTLR